MKNGASRSKIQAAGELTAPTGGREASGSRIGRRRFLQESAAGVVGSGILLSSWPSVTSAGTPPQPASAAPWYRNAFRRNVIDMHITDWNETFLSEFDPDEYVRLLKMAEVQSTVLYAHSHVGLTNFPTKVGRQHRGMQGKDHLRTVIDNCHKQGINVVLYYSVIFDRVAYESNPDWRIIRVDGKEAAERSRHGLCCPNSPYRNYVVALAQEICNGYQFEGIRFDMTFWPEVCYCRYCQKRFAQEAGGELPKVINWEDPKWVSFQRKREEWLVDFARLLTSTVKKIKPQVSVEHQSSTYPLGWRFGVTHELSRQNDFLQGDFYGGALQGSFVRKLLYSLTENQPYGFETSVTVSLRNHTAKKTEALLEAKAAAAMADAGAFIFIDAIDPAGTLNETVYRRMGEIFRETRRYEEFLGGEPCRDVGIYFSTESKCDFADNGKAPNDPKLSTKSPHVEATLNFIKACIQQHIPYGIVTKKNLAKLSEHKIVVLPNVLMMDDEEADALKKYVREGGALYASKYSSLITKAGMRKPDFLLAEVFGASWMGETKENYTFIAPTEAFKDLFPEFSPKHPVGLEGTQLIVKARSGAQTVGKLVLPYTDPTDPTRYASIHSNPPGIPTSHPCIVLNRYGKGKALYAAGELENSDTYLDILGSLIRLLYTEFTFEAEAPSSVEMTAFRQDAKKRLLINMVNFQEQLPNIPVEGIRVKVMMGTRKPKQLVVLPEGKKLNYQTKDGVVEFAAPRLETFLVLALDYA